MMTEETRDSVLPPRKFKRRLTPFLCQELLYEYVSGQLDPEREQAVRECLQRDAESREALAQVESGLQYASSLAEVQMADPLLNRLKHHEGTAYMVIRRIDWNNWPAPARWVMVGLASVLVVGAAVLSMPWHQIESLRPRESGPLVLAEIPNDKGQQVVLAPGPLPDSEGSAGTVSGVAADADHHDHDHDHAAAEGEETEIHVDAKAVVEAPKAMVEAPKATQPSPSVPTLPKLTPTPVPEIQASAEAEGVAEATPERKETAAKGFVYRAFMDLPNVDELTEEITEKIVELGGTKAGDVELGWKRGNGSYFHFSLPESNEPAVIEYLQAYGPVRISKDPHPRVMPRGQVRFILWIERKEPGI